MNESPANHLSITSTSNPPSITLTIFLNGERTAVTLDPAEAVLAGNRLLSEALKRLPDHQEFVVTPEPQETSAPLPSPPPVPFPSPSFSAPSTVTEASFADEHDDVPRSEEPISVPPGYESFLAPEEAPNWRVTVSARARGETIGVTPEQMVEAANFPDHIEHPNETARAHVRDGISVLIPTADPDAIIGVTLVTRAKSGAIPKAGSGGPGRKMPSSFPELQKMAEAHGFCLEDPGRNHAKLRHPDHPGLMMPVPGTPSDHRSYQNFISRVQRMFGVDITHAP